MLPILVIDTESQQILDEPKINVHLGVIDNGPGQINNITDPYNGYDDIIGIELRGQTSQFFPKQPYGFETRDENGANNNVELLGMPAENDWVLHNPFSDKSLLRNVLAYKIAEELMDYAPRTRLCEVILNDQYQGIYVLTEKIKVDDGRVDIARLRPEDISGDELTGGYLIKIDKPYQEISLGWRSTQNTFFYFHDPKIDELNTTQKQYIIDWMNGFESSLLGPNFADPTTGYQSYVDINSFVDFFIVNEISRNVDGYRLSTYLHKDKDSEGGLLKMGPVWDFNLGFGNADYCDGWKTNGWSYQFNQVCPGDAWQVPFWWDRLMLDPTFKSAIKMRWETLRTDFLSDQNMTACIDDLVSNMGQAPTRNFQQWPVLAEYVWPNSYVGDNYNNEITFLKDWLLDRMEWIDGAVINFENVSPDPVDMNDPVINPNPFSNELLVDYFSAIDKEMTLQLYNSVGALMFEIDQVAYNDGWNRLNIAPSLSDGIYFYKILISGEERNSGKIVKH